MEFITKSAKETQDLAKKIILGLIKKKQSRALILGLIGELGAGKTTFIQGLGQALKIKEKILSPTFVIMRRFKIRELGFTNFYHVDCYRLEGAKEMIEIGFAEIIKDPKNIVVIEWAEKIKDILPKDSVWINFKHQGENKRWIQIKM